MAREALVHGERSGRRPAPPRNQEPAVQLEDFGWNSFLAAEFAKLDDPDLLPARVSEELRGWRRVLGAGGEHLAEISGKIRHRSHRRAELPTVGDWVAISSRPGQPRVRIERVMPRRSKLSRKVAGRVMDEQLVAANVEVVFVVSALNREFNPRRIERYLAMGWEGGARPVILLNKADLCDQQDAAELASEMERAAPGVPVVLMSAAEGTGLEQLGRYLPPGQTAAFAGSSGVGKSTIINALLGSEVLAVGGVRESDDRGRHTTTSRRLILLPAAGVAPGALVIDTPGMRELEPWDSAGGLAQAFEDVAELARDCRFRDCSHRSEPGCAVIAAITEGRLESARLENLRKIEAEMEFQRSKADTALGRQTKERWKKLHKAQREAYRLRPK
jgi:ribosome biogenesis GTPase / thiamine phosphate phosphatase